MANKIKIDKDTYECPVCRHRWSTQFAIAELSFNEEECCLCCPDCSELIDSKRKNNEAA